MDVDEVPSVEDTEEKKEDERITEESSQEPSPTVENGDSKPQTPKPKGLIHNLRSFSYRFS